ncbi:MFS transporter [Mangrovibacterium diazotrophicum]|uniref:Fucose permease n=1 Tax=Mangrovibacterium diazotrophicum TaxID=1261403 RepID=A0A419VYG1_9BACT|nr:MFS transporter [Mangrovibacterium diazotrophicum]RKD88277.1 fucose permease [Mangrovibacterium diazotrophicum]
MTKKNLLIGLIFLIFFCISFLTNILGAINPDVSASFSLSGAMTGMLPFSFFIAYAVMSIPSGFMVQKYGEKKSMLLAWILAGSGALLFSCFPGFPVFLCSLFLIGTGMAILQVAINPLLRVVGGEQQFAFLSVSAQLVFGGASFLSPFVYSYLSTNLPKGDGVNGFVSLLQSLTPEQLPRVSLYWIFAFVALAMLVLIGFAALPKVERKDDEVVGAWETHLLLFKDRTTWLFFFGIAAYVGSEQGIANWISEFLKTYHGLDPQVEGAKAVGWFWGLLTLGCLLGMVLLKFLSSKVVLRMFTVAALVVLFVALFGDATMALYGFPALGFCLSVMWSIVFALALNSIPKYHGTFSGILCTGIAGGAIVPLIIGQLKDLIGLRFGMLFLLVTLGYILSISFWAKPLVSNLKQD